MNWRGMSELFLWLSGACWGVAASGGIEKLTAGFMLLYLLFSVGLVIASVIAHTKARTM